MPLKILITGWISLLFIAAYSYLLWCLYREKIHYRELLKFISYKTCYKKNEPFKFWFIWSTYFIFISFLFIAMLIDFKERLGRPIEQFLFNL